MLKRRNQELTWNVTEAIPFPLNGLKMYLEFGTQEWSIHVRDCHWFKLSESPTNIIFFPLHFCNKLNPLNLHKTQFKKSAQYPIGHRVAVVIQKYQNGTWVENRKRAASDIWDKIYRGGRTFGSWTPDLWRDSWNRKGEKKKHRRPMNLWTSCIYLLQVF